MTPRKSQIRTLSDLNGNSSSPGGGGGNEHHSAYHKPISYSSSASTNASSNNSKDQASTMKKKVDPFRVCAIPTLPNADAALAMIQRVCTEFEPIVQRRGYNVKSVSEMCCCFDGLDFTESGQRSKGRKKRVMSPNVWGYNQTTSFGRRGNKSHTIHLRLRHPGSHDRLLLYEDVAGTMAHELAHCEIGPHNDAFNKLMEEILEEHMTLQVTGTIGSSKGGVINRGNNNNNSGGGNYQSFPGKGVALGSGAGSKTDPKHPGYKLGGDNNFSKWISPGEAACIAAEARRRQQQLRLRGQHCCQPCTITIPDDDDAEPIIEYHTTSVDVDENGDKKRSATTVGVNRNLPTSRRNRDNKNGEKKKKYKTDTSNSSSAESTQTKKEKSKGDVIDLTDDDAVGVAAKSTTASVPSASASASEVTEWACQRCTFLNTPMALACSMCSAQKRT